MGLRKRPSDYAEITKYYRRDYAGLQKKNRRDYKNCRRDSGLHRDYKKQCWDYNPGITNKHRVTLRLCWDYNRITLGLQLFI